MKKLTKVLSRNIKISDLKRKDLLLRMRKKRKKTVICEASKDKKHYPVYFNSYNLSPGFISPDYFGRPICHYCGRVFEIHFYTQINKTKLMVSID